MKRIVVDPAQISVLGARPAGNAPTTGPGAWLRRNRLRLAGLIAAAEAIGIGFFVHGASRLVLLAVAAGLILAHFYVTPRIGSYTLRQLTWTLAFAQGLIAVLSILLFVAGVVVAMVLFGVLIMIVLTGIAALLGDRR